MENERFEFRLSAGRRRELAELAAETGISSADLARLAIKQFLERPVESKRVDEFANMSDEELRQYVYGNKESDR